MQYLAIVLGVVVAVAVLALARARIRANTGAPDPFTVGEPWRNHVAAALSAQRRFDALVGHSPQGPLRVTLERVGGRLHDAVAECWTIARRGDELDATIRHLDAPRLRSRLDATADETTRGSLEQQLASVDRIRAVRDDTDRRLQALQARLGELVSDAAVLLSDASGAAAHEGALDALVDDLVIQVRTVQQAIDELPGPGTALPPA